MKDLTLFNHLKKTQTKTKTKTKTKAKTKTFTTCSFQDEEMRDTRSDTESEISESEKEEELADLGEKIEFEVDGKSAVEDTEMPQGIEMRDVDPRCGMETMGKTEDQISKIEVGRGQEKEEKQD